jgi:hypothetical protein
VDTRNRRLGKQHVLNAVQVNLTMLQVLIVANCVTIQRILVEKEETAVASSVQWVGRLKTAVWNVSVAMQGHFHLALGVKNVPKDMLEAILTLHNVANAKRVKQHWSLVQRLVNFATPVGLAVAMAHVRNALLVFTKTPKAKQDASSVNWENLSTM